MHLLRLKSISYLKNHGSKEETSSHVPPPACRMWQWTVPPVPRSSSSCNGCFLRQIHFIFDNHWAKETSSHLTCLGCGGELSHLCQGILLVVPGQLASRPVLQWEWRPNCGTRRRNGRHDDAGPGRLGQRRDDQEVSDVQRAYRARRRLRADDVQAVQTRVLLVLPQLARCEWYRTATVI